MTEPFAPDSIDAFIAGRLPAWLTTCTLDRLHLLHRALQEQQQASHALGDILKHLPGLKDFARPLLQDALKGRGLSHVDIESSWVHVEREIFIPDASPALPDRRMVSKTRQGVLAAALHNFHISETRPSYLRRGRLTDAHGNRLEIGFEVFAGLCRELDIGGRYQALLARHLTPADTSGQSPGHAARVVRSMFARSLRAHFEVAVRMAVLKGQLQERVYFHLLATMSPRPAVSSVQGSVTARQLYLLGKKIRGVIALEIADASGTIALLWIPGDQEKPLAQYPSWQALYDALAVRLRHTEYRQFFMRFVSERDRARFTALLTSRLADASGSQPPNLDGRALAFTEALFEHLAELHISKIIDDARVLATPTGDEDEADRRQRLQAYAELGLGILNLAGLFIPVVGQLLLLGGALQIADEVYEGYEDWAIGDREGALGHLFGVAETVIVGALIAKGSSMALRALDRLTFVDELAPIVNAAGQTRLCATDLDGYRLSAGEAHATAQAPRSDAWLLHLGDDTFRVIDDGVTHTSKIQHPKRITAHSPEVYTSDSGAWFHALEFPHEWQGSGTLLRRMTVATQAVTDSTAEQLIHVTGFSEARLRQLLLERGALPSRIADTFELYQLREQNPGLSGRALDEQQRLGAPSLNEEEQVLRRDFPGLSARGIKEVLADITDEQLDSLQVRKKVPLGIAERARWLLRDARLDRACAGLRWSRLENADTERLAFGLLGKLVPDPPRVELREGSVHGELLAVSGAADGAPVQTLVREGSHYRLDGTEHAPQGLIECLVLTLSDEQKATLGDVELTPDALRERLVMAAAGNREAVGALIGQAPADGRLRPPRRFADGRVGYALSGRGDLGRRTVRRGIHRIFPTLSDEQMDAYLVAVMQRGGNLWDHCTELERQFAALRLSLHNWRSQAVGLRDSLRRRRVAQQLRRSWRRKITDDMGEFVLEIEGQQVGLPELPHGLDYGHISRLKLRNMGLARLPRNFLARFFNLRELDLRDNRLEAIPEGIQHLHMLRKLRLGNNRLSMSPAAESQLRTLTRLQVLDLEGNPLGRSPNLSNLRHLRHVGLRGTRLTEFPTAFPSRAFLDLRENSIRQLRQDVGILRDRLQRIALHDNPLDAHSQQILQEVQVYERSHGYEHRSADERVRDNWLGPQMGEQRERYIALWQSLHEQSGSNDLFRFLADFSHGRDFEQHPGHYRSRVWRLLEFCEQNEQIRDRLFATASGPRTCDDRLLYTLGELEVGMQAERLLGNLPPRQLDTELWRLGLAYFRLDEVDAIAARQVERMRAEDIGMVDEIEVRFFYRSRLAHELGLPVASDSMHFPMYANVTTRDLLNAQEQVLGAENADVLVRSLAGRSFWERHVREHYSPRFEALVDRFQVLQEDNAAEQEAGRLSEWQYNENALRISHDYEAAERELTQTLARELYERISPAAPPGD